MKRIRMEVTKYEGRADLLTHAKRTILNYIKEFRFMHYGNSPSLKEIMAYCGYASPYAVQRHVGGLVRLGLLKKVGKRAFLVPVEET